MNGTHAIPPAELISYRINHLKVAAPAAILGVAALALAGLLGVSIGRWSDFTHAYLAGFLFWFGISIGCIGLTMLHHLTGGRWGDVTRPLLETGARGVFLMLILFVPIALSMGWIYPWAQDPQHLSTKLLHQRELWASPGFFVVRAVLYFGVLLALMFLLNRKFRLRDEMAVQDPEHNSGKTFRMISGPGIVILGIVITLATIDWAMSIQAGWFSTIYGLYFLASSGLSTFCFMVIVALLITRQWETRHGRDVHHSLIGKQDWHDLGNLMLAFTMLWGYMSLSQMLIIYSGNLPQETEFYHARSINGWQYVGGALIALHFALPFFLLLMRDIKRDPKKLVWLAVGILLVRQLDFFYQIHPSYGQGLPGREFGDVGVSSPLGMHTIMNVLTPIGIGGLWIAFFAWNLKDRRVLPAPASEGHHHG